MIQFFFVDLPRFLFEWVEAWPLWLKILVIVTVVPVMVLHFLLWVAWRPGMLDEDQQDNVVPFHKQGRP